MSHFVKNLTILALAVMVLLSMSAFAQSDSKTTVVARAEKPASSGAIPAAPAQRPASRPSQNWMTRRFEISFQGGGVIGGNMGQPDIGNCVSAGSLGGGFTDGCDPNQDLGIENADGLYETNITGIRTFQRFGGIQPGNGGLWGLRLGFNISPKWQLEFIYNHVYSGTAFTNQNIADDRIALLNGGFINGSAPDHRLVYLDHAYGTPRGEQNMYLFNINRNFNAGGRIVPYIGGGMGVVHWYAGPKLNVATQTGRSNNLQSTEITKYSRPDTGFAFDLSAGVKAYMTPNFGVRGDVMQVWSFPGSLSSRASTVDLSGTQFTSPAGALFPISGTTSQSGKFSQTAFTGGVFWAFGGGWQNEHQNVGTFGNSNENFWDHWELSWTFGGVHGRDLGQGQYRCTPGLADGCLYNNLDLFADGGSGVYPRMTLDALPQYLSTGYTKPGDGWATGGRLAYSFTPHWDVAFIWNLAGTGSHFSNQRLFDTALGEFYRSEGDAVPPKAAFALGGHDGHASGTQSMYLVNIDRNFHATRRFVPYVGAGLGWVSWNGGPNTQYRFDRSGSSTPGVADVFKTAHNENAFAFDLGGGVKYYLTRHFGIRADVMDVFSFGDSRTDFGTVDTSGLFGTPGALVPVTGRVTGDAHYSQIVTQAGIFYSFGQGGTWNSDYSSTGSGRWDISLQAGGVVGGNFGQSDEPKCTSIATAGTATGCDTNQSLTHTESGIYPGRIGGIRMFQRYGGIEPGNGGIYGVRLGYNITPSWQLEFIWNHASTGTALINQEMIAPALISQNTGRDFNRRDGAYINDGTGKPQGNQNMYLFNINRKFNLTGRVVPYVGAGAGMESWYAGPNLNFFYSSDESRNNSPGNIGKFTSGQNAFAFDLATGAKIYVGKNYGFRADFTDVMSFADFTTTSITNGQGADNFPTDVGLFPISARLKQTGRFNQAIFSGGVFWDIGGRNTTDGYKPPTGDRDSVNDKWEFGINFGGAHGAPWGTDTASCTEAIPGGCDFTNTSLSHRGGGPYPGHLLRGQVPETMVEAGLKPGDGWMTGFQIGFNWTPEWQIAFIYNILGTGTRFDNHAAMENGMVAFFSGCDCTNNTNGGRALLFDHRSDGRAQGIQHQFLVNLNRNFHVNSRIVPYVGAGVGGEVWAHNPEMGWLVHTESGDPILGSQDLLLTKKYSSQAGFAVDLTGGVKFYVGRHWGLKAEAMNVTSFQEFGGRFSTIDVNGFLGTPGAAVGLNGTNKQTTRFNQTSGSGGLFWTF